MNGGLEHLPSAGARAALALLLLAACAPEPPEAEPEASPAASAPDPSFAGRVWIRADSSGLPGVMRIFLADGTLLLDSCWETYRLASWRMLSDSTLAWSEDGMEIEARVLGADEESLRLRLALVDGPHEESYRPAPVPFVCPDMPR